MLLECRLRRLISLELQKFQSVALTVPAQLHTDGLRLFYGLLHSILLQSSIPELKRVLSSYLVDKLRLVCCTTTD